MNHELYNQLLNAAAVMVGTQKFDRAITAKRDEWSDLCVEFTDAEEKAKKAHRSYGGLTGLGVFFMLYGFVNGFMLALVSLSFLLTESVDFFSFIVLFFVSAILLFMGFLGIFFFFLARIKRKKRKAKAFKQCEEEQKEIQLKIDAVENEEEELQANLREFADKNQHYLDFLPSSYRNPQAIGFMLKAVENLRADCLKDVINLYEQELHYLEQERILNNTAEMQRIYNENLIYVMDSIDRNQRQINSSLQNIQTLQFISMLDD